MVTVKMSWGGLPTAWKGGKEVLGVSPNSVVISSGDFCSAMFVIGGRIRFGRKCLGNLQFAARFPLFFLV